MRYFFLVIAFIGFANTANAQFFSKERLANLQNFDQQRWTWGYFLGFNNFDFKFDYKENLPVTDVVVIANGGFNVGLIGDLRINDYFNLRLEPGLIYTERNLIFNQFEDESDFLRESKSTYIHIPLLLKVSTKRHNNIKPFLVAGVSTSVNLSSNEESPSDNLSGKFRMTKNTYYYELGFGIDLYLFYFKFTPSIRGVFALNDELIRDFDPNSPYTGNIDKMSSRGVFINFTFQ